MKFLEKEITTKTTVIKKLLVSMVNSTIIIYILIGPLNKQLSDILNAIKNGLFSAVTVAIILLPIIMIIGIILTLGNIIIKNK